MGVFIGFFGFVLFVGCFFVVDFFLTISLCRGMSDTNTIGQITCNTSGTYYMQHAVFHIVQRYS